MQKIKDILYDTNDLLVALLIIGFAVLLIRDRIDVILDYPSVNAGGGAVYEESGLTDGGADSADGADADDDAETGDAPTGDTGDAATGDTGGAATGETPASPTGEPVKYSLYIAYGETAAQIAQKLLDAGLIKSNNEFYDALSATDAATKLQAGNFVIAEGATLAEIVDILTGR
jgi:hypothetical protein